MAVPAAPADDAPLQDYFVALLPPEPVQAAATAIKTDFRDRYQSQGALRSPPHITLQPPFSWPSSDRAALLAALAAFVRQRSPLPVQLSGFGAFPPRVIFIRVEPSAELAALQADLSAFLAAELAIAPQFAGRPFVPHLTVAFRDLKPAAFAAAWPTYEQQPFAAAFTAARLTLLLRTERHWQVDTEFELGG
jgi:2'-5' RNA ligase